METPKRLTFYAPRRASHRSSNSFYTRPWTEREVLEYLSIGGWFMKGAHDFADRAAERAAGFVFKE